MRCWTACIFLCLLCSKTACILLPILAVARGVLHYAEQGCNHFIAFKLLAFIRDKVFGVLRQLAPPSWRAATRAT